MTYVRRISLAAFFFLLLALTTAPVQAQSTWQETFGTQIAELLRSPDQSLQDHGMRTLIEVADQRADVQLQAAATPLLDIYDASSDPSRRLNAVVALSKIDDPVSYTTLLVMAMDEPNDRVRQTILDAAAESRSIQQSTVARAYNRLLQHTPPAESRS
jgi:HEAT repeat protein